VPIGGGMMVCEVRASYRQQHAMGDHESVAQKVAPGCLIQQQDLWVLDDSTRNRYSRAGPQDGRTGNEASRLND